MSKKYKLTIEQCFEILKELREGGDAYLLARTYEVSISTLEIAKLRALAIEKGITFEEMKQWKKNAFAYDPKTKKPILK